MSLYKLNFSLCLLFATFSVIWTSFASELISTHPQHIHEIPNPLSDSDFEYNYYVNAYNTASEEDKTTNWLHFLNYRKERADLEHILEDLERKVHKLQTALPINDHLLSLLQHFKEDLEEKRNFANNAARFQTISQTAQMLWIIRDITDVHDTLLN